jgi:carbonic anhydrase/acetyltransferase-like protein (isoleucine patch superfamily)
MADVPGKDGVKVPIKPGDLVAGGVHGGGGSKLIANFVAAAEYEIRETLPNLPQGGGYAHYLKQTLADDKMIEIVTVLKDKKGNELHSPGLLAYSWPGKIQLLDTYWESKLESVDLARKERLQIIHELFRATPDTDEHLSLNDEGYRITIGILKLHLPIADNCGSNPNFIRWPNGGGCVEKTVKADPEAFIASSTVEGDVEIASHASIVSSSVKSNGGKLVIGSQVMISSSSVNARGEIKYSSDIRSSGLSGEITPESKGGWEINSGGADGTLTIGYHARITSGSANGTVTLGDYASVQNSTVESGAALGRSVTADNSSVTGNVLVADHVHLYNARLIARQGSVTIGQTATLYDVELAALGETVTIGQETMLNNVYSKGSLSIGQRSSVQHSNFGGNVTIAPFLILCRMYGASNTEFTFSDCKN